MGTGQNTAALPVGYGTTLGTTSSPALPANPGRNALMFVNAGSTLIAIAPAFVNAGVNGVYTGLAQATAVIGGAGSITMAPGDKFIIDTFNCTNAWVGISAAAGGVLTVLES